MVNFKELLVRAKSGDNSAIEELLKMYRPMLFNESRVDKEFDEDLYQELCIKFLHCIEKFSVDGSDTK